MTTYFVRVLCTVCRPFLYNLLLAIHLYTVTTADATNYLLSCLNIRMLDLPFNARTLCVYFFNQLGLVVQSHLKYLQVCDLGDYVNLVQ